MTDIQKYVDDKGNIKKGDLIKDSLKNAPVLPKEEVLDKLQVFFKQNSKDNKFFMLNARDINYVQIFDISEQKDARKIAEFLYKFFEDSGFCTVEEQDKPGLIPATDVVHHKMTSIKDIDIEGKSEAGIYIDDSYFKIVVENWMVEKIK